MMPIASFKLRKRQKGTKRKAFSAYLDSSGVAAVEFAFILPLLLLIYLGANGLTQAISAARAATILTRTIADLVSQQPPNAPLTDTTAQNIFAASTAELAPFSTTGLKMTLSNIEFVPNGSATTSGGYDAKTRWSVSFSGGALRACAPNPYQGPVITAVPNGTRPSMTTMPVGLYAAGFLIVADVTYVYNPTLGLFTWDMANGRASSSPVAFNMSRTEYMRPRQTDNIRYTAGSSGTTATICPISSPQVN